MNSSTLLAKMYELGVSPSRSRPGVSNDNPYSESLFRTLKYCPQWPAEGFASLEAARHWVKVFTDWYNGEHRHSRIRYVTPNERHARKDKQILKRREHLHQESRRVNIPLISARCYQSFEANGTVGIQQVSSR